MPWTLSLRRHNLLSSPTHCLPVPALVQVSPSRPPLCAVLFNRSRNPCVVMSITRWINHASHGNNAWNGVVLASYLAQSPNAHKPREAISSSPFFFLFPSPQHSDAIFFSVTAGLCYGHTSYCSAALQVLCKVIRAGQPQQPDFLWASTSAFSPGSWQVGTVQTGACDAGHRRTTQSNPIWFFLHLWSWLSGFLLLCSHPEVPPEAICHRFPYRRPVIWNCSIGLI